MPKLTTSARWLFASAVALASQITASATPLIDALDKAILDDLLEQYSTYVPTTCPGTDVDSATNLALDATTSFSYAWPGTNAASEWYAPFVPFEESLFQAVMSYDDGAGDRGWSIRVGTGGNVYSHFTDMYGETMPPQAHATAPWIDEVFQMVAVNTVLNKNTAYPQYCPGPNTENKDECKPYFLHQAGAYQQDDPFTDVPFFSPALARHCSGNSCSFLSWGTSAHVNTPFTSPVIYMNRYTNCGNGKIEHTQMMHNFADPNNALSTSTNIDQRYFNVGWGGVRASTLPFALEPNPTDGSLDYADPDNVDFLYLCNWGLDDPNKDTTPADSTVFKDLKDLGGYTTFVADGLLVNKTLPDVLPWCRKASDPTCSDASSCMVATCTDANIAAGYTRLQLKVRPNSSPNCAYHSMHNGYVGLQCDLRDKLFGQSSPYLSGGDPCMPWTALGFFNMRTNEGLPVEWVRHWSWSPNNYRTYFTVYETDTTKAINMVNDFFTNVGYSDELLIDVRPTSNIEEIPTGYDPASIPSFTWVYGKGEDYGDISKPVQGKSRRRIGSSSRDYTVFTINWWGASRLTHGNTYVNRGYMFHSNLGTAKATADSLIDSVYADQFGVEQFTPRRVDIYTKGSSFVVKTAASAGGQTTTCDSLAATLSCSGWSTPKSGFVPFFAITCGAQTHLGDDPYHFTPPFAGHGEFPGHGLIASPVRSYLCDGQDVSIRPTWKMLGFFDNTDAGCVGLSGSTYEETVCDTPTSSPSRSPSTSPTKKPMSPPSISPTTSQPTTSQPTKNPTSPPSVSPTTSQPTKNPTSSPSTANPTNGPTGSPTALPKDGYCSDNSGRCSVSDLSDCDCLIFERRLLMKKEEHPNTARRNSPGESMDNLFGPNRLPRALQTGGCSQYGKRSNCVAVAGCEWSGGACISSSPPATGQPSSSPTKQMTTPPTNPPSRLPTSPPTNPPSSPPTSPPTNPPSSSPTHPPSSPPPVAQLVSSAPVCQQHSQHLRQPMDQRMGRVQIQPSQLQGQLQPPLTHQRTDQVQIQRFQLQGQLHPPLTHQRADRLKTRRLQLQRQLLCQLLAVSVPNRQIVPTAGHAAITLVVGAILIHNAQTSDELFWIK
eukprot:CAMPEP_0183721232 /NCGR_PEP_ID=MMETSP0737-20130205/13573_1 /TAXON_ID=385413 /ORGANISM="Thalassiosira miniscula, Strain CCMP1093" /LENGTH=1108 /DNA_ID=CAMNT_0025951205 /DNA_START=33 /DNA_END=3360 /DNA_ORIENTATION=-